MVFANLTTLYLPAVANAGVSQWGTDVRKLLDAADASADDQTTTTEHGTGGAQAIRTFDPYTTLFASDAAEANYGWAVTPADMGSVAGARRFFRAGNHVLTTRMSHSGALGTSGTLYIFAYRISNAAGGRARTLLGSANTAFNYPPAGAAFTATITLTLPEIIFEDDETIQYSFEASAVGVLATGHSVRFHTGTSTTPGASRILTPGLGTLKDTTGTATGSGTATGAAAKLVGTIGTATGSGTATGAMSAQAATTGTAAGTATADGQTSAVAGTVGTASGAGAASGDGGKVLGTVGTVDIGGGGGATTVLHPIFIFDD